MEECRNRYFGELTFGSAFICGGDWLYKFPIGNGERRVDFKCLECPYFCPGVVMY